MPRFAANLSLLFTEYPLPQRFAAAAAAGFSAVEIQFPYDYPAETLHTAARAAGVRIILINLPAGDLMEGGYGLASHPARQAGFEDALARGLAYARTLQADMVNILAGRYDPAFSREQTHATLAANVGRSARQMAPHGIRVTCEAINTLDMPGFVISTPDELASLLQAVNHPNATMQLDLYHLARMQIGIPEALSHYLPKIGHIQFADHPGRGEPGTGTLPLMQIFDFLDDLGYSGWCAAEYRPGRTTTATLGWLSS